MSVKLCSRFDWYSTVTTVVWHHLTLPYFCICLELLIICKFDFIRILLGITNMMEIWYPLIVLLGIYTYDILPILGVIMGGNHNIFYVVTEQKSPENLWEVYLRHFSRHKQQQWHNRRIYISINNKPHLTKSSSKIATVPFQLLYSLLSWKMWIVE